MRALELFADLGIKAVATYKYKIGVPGPLETACPAVVDRMIRRHGLSHATLTLRTIAESEGNQRALTEDIIGAISDVISAHPRWASLGLTWLGAFDQIKLVEIRKIVKDAGARPLRAGIATLIAIELSRLLGPSKPRKVTKLPVSVSVSDRLALGVGLIKIKAEGRQDFKRSAYRRFKVDAQSPLAYRAMAAAALYAARPEITSRLSWNALWALSAPSLPPAIRKDLEARIIAGQSVTETDIDRARGKRTAQTSSSDRSAWIAA
jgi:hypothetical protein